MAAHVAPVSLLASRGAPNVRPARHAVVRNTRRASIGCGCRSKTLQSQRLSCSVWSNCQVWPPSRLRRKCPMGEPAGGALDADIQQVVVGGTHRQSTDLVPDARTVSQAQLPACAVVV